MSTCRVSAVVHLSQAEANELDWLGADLAPVFGYAVLRQNSIWKPNNLHITVKTRADLLGKLAERRIENGLGLVVRRQEPIGHIAVWRQTHFPSEHSIDLRTPRTDLKQRGRNDGAGRRVFAWI